MVEKKKTNCNRRNNTLALFNAGETELLCLIKPH